MTDKERKLFEQSGLLFPANAVPPPRLPIEMTLETIRERVREETEGLVFRAVQNARVKVNREELIRALELDKKLRAGKLVEVVWCKDCKHSDDIPGGRICRYGVCVDCVVEDYFFCRYGKRKEKPDEL